MSKVTISAGICGFTATIIAKNNEDECVDVTFSTTCPNFKKLEKENLEFDPLVCCFGKLAENEVFELFKSCCPHPTCPIPTAFLKAIEVEGGLALPKDVIMTIEK
ncbi:MAG: hypothetical protein R3Y47_04090 [Lachnospiraceae bacterium]